MLLFFCRGSASSILLPVRLFWKHYPLLFICIRVKFEYIVHLFDLKYLSSGCNVIFFSLYVNASAPMFQIRREIRGGEGVYRQAVFRLGCVETV